MYRRRMGNAGRFYLVSALLVLKLLLLRMLFFDRIAWEWVLADAAPALLLMGILAAAVPRRAKTAAFWTLNVILSLLLFAASVYFNHFGSVPTYLALAELHQVFQIRDSVESTIQPIDYLFFADIAVYGIYRLLRRGKAGMGEMRSGDAPSGLRWVYPAVIMLSIFGGASLSAYSIHASSGITNELAQAESAGFLNYEVVAAIRERQNSELVGTGNIKDTIAKVEELETSYNYAGAPSGTPSAAYYGAMQGKNVIVVQMEAFQNFPLHQSLDGQELTPNLNRLADEGLYFPHVYQQIGPGNTSDAEFMSNTSIYPIGTLAMSTGFGDRKLPGLPRVLESKGYEAYTFHVNKVGFWNRKELYAALGFNGYYDKPYYKNDHFNAFGASDEQLYITGVQKLAELGKKGTPFYAQFVTASSHHPFQIPDAFKRITVPDHLQGTMLGDYLTAINYTDYAIGTLIDGLKQNGLWDSTVLVLYGDHFGLQPQSVPPEQVEGALGIKYDSRVSRFNIPLIIHMPGSERGKTVETTGGQLDIMPTLANLLGISLKSEGVTPFGHDLLNIRHNVLGMRYYLPSGSFFNDDILFVPGKSFQDGEAISLKTLQPVADFARYERDYKYILQWMSLSDEYVKLLPKR
ncbi:phosphoglycerol transferase MdoB-like AlkP superfamily enzyme [Paenibacillus forsythiae]|uniref:Phosphoglycerol transferase MdoB-like AlkP superfamily enzyme n=1 Tax=Paenibacillus forsythiae TaxID=365616 RepID=A0ABU3HC24_9BACL|nr:LTA synthase family protein [Paenibacillus forsythiae]MDT3428369.1 phosphoglycerol transferase MdoB-like AlkP superfamily enzyme [Paenibacillus forsythiae]